MFQERYQPKAYDSVELPMVIVTKVSISVHTKPSFSIVILPHMIPYMHSFLISMEDFSALKNASF